jgi:hypothetical protein
MPESERILCNKCGVVTPHEVNLGAKHDDSTENWSASTRHQILICVVCSEGTYRKRVWFSEFQDPDPGADSVYEDTYHPPRLKKPLPKWHDQLPETLQEVLREAYTALQHDLRYIAAIGCRTALDIAAVEKVGDVGAFVEKLKKLVADKHISEDEKELILAVSDSGDAAAHRGFKPDIAHLMTLVDVLERLLHKFYIKPKEDQALLEEARKFRSKVPVRVKKKTSPI